MSIEIILTHKNLSEYLNLEEISTLYSFVVKCVCLDSPKRLNEYFSSYSPDLQSQLPFKVESIRHCHSSMSLAISHLCYQSNYYYQIQIFKSVSKLFISCTIYRNGRLCISEISENSKQCTFFSFSEKDGTECGKHWQNQDHRLRLCYTSGCYVKTNNVIKLSYFTPLSDLNQ